MATVFINEFHYNNTGTDTNQFVEIAGPAGTDLTNYRIVLYGDDGKFYKDVKLGDVLDNPVIQNQNDKGFGTVAVDFSDIKDGTGAIALLSGPGALEQFLGYGSSTITAVDEPSTITPANTIDGQTSALIGTQFQQSDSTPANSSLQLQGTGDENSDFQWKIVQGSNTKSAVNAGQTLESDNNPAGDKDAPVIDGSSLVGGPNLERTNAIEITFTEGPGAPLADGIKAGSGKISIFNNNGTLVQAFNAADFKTDTAATATTAEDDKVVINPTNNKIFINPKDDLVAGTTYYVQIDNGAITDLAGNAYTAETDDKAELTFTADDIVLPKEVSRTPDDTATDVAVDSNLTITFDEDVKQGSGTIKLFKDDGVVGTFTDDVPVQANVTFNGDTVTIDPVAKLEQGVNYYVTVDSDNTGTTAVNEAAITDLAANAAAGIVAGDWNFITANTTAPLEDTAARTPVLNAINIPVGEDLNLTFNEDVKAGTGNILIKKSSDNTTVATIPVGDIAQVKFDGKKVTIDPTNDLDPSTQYYVEIGNGVITDLSGESFAGITGASAFTFTTVSENVKPTVDKVFDGTDTERYPLDENLEIKFSEEIKAGKGKIFLKKEDGTVVGEVELDGETPSATPINGTDLDVTIDASSDTLTIDPASDLDKSTSFYVEIQAGAIEDLNGNPFDGITDKTIASFTTANDDGPVVVKFSPTDNLTNVPIDGDLEIEFNEDISIVNANNIFVKSIDGTDIRSGAGVLSVSVTDNNKLTIDPANNLSTSKEYYVEIADGAIESLDSDTFDGITDKTIFNFTTAAAGEPVAIEFTPTDDSQGVALGDDLKITFNEAVTEGTGNISIFKADDTLVEAINVNTSKVSSSGNTITINPTVDLEANTDYYVQVADGAIVDLNGEAYDGISDKATFNFSTTLPDTTAPTAPTVTPATGTEFTADGNLVLTFNEPIQEGTGNITLVDANGNTVETFTLDGDAATATTGVTINGSTITIDPSADLAAGTGFSIQIGAGAVADVAGNAFAGISDNSVSFTTVAATGTPPVTPPVTPPGTVITPIDTNTDGNGNVMEVIDLSGVTAGQTVTASFEINRDADFDNNVYFYKVDGAADGNIGGLAPDASGYLQAALNNVVNQSNALTTANGQTTTGSLDITGGDILGIAIVADGTLAQATNNISSVEGVYLSYMGANTDNGSFDHIRVNGNTFEFEDLANGGDRDFNDMTIKMDFTTV